MANNNLHASEIIIPGIKNMEGPGPTEWRQGVLYHMPYQGEKDPPEIWTIGYGSSFNVSELPKYKQGITADEADKRLRARIAKEFETPIKSQVVVNLKQHQFDALVSMVYNCGPGSIYGDIGDAINAKNFYGAVRLMITLYVKTRRFKSDPKRVTDGLVRRRLCEAWLFHTGELYLINTAQKRDLMLRRFVEKGLLNPVEDHHVFPDWEKHPKTGFPA